MFCFVNEVHKPCQNENSVRFHLDENRNGLNSVLYAGMVFRLTEGVSYHSLVSKNVLFMAVCEVFLQRTAQGKICHCL